MTSIPRLSRAAAMLLSLSLLPLAVLARDGAGPIPPQAGPPGAALSYGKAADSVKPLIQSAPSAGLSWHSAPPAPVQDLPGAPAVSEAGGEAGPSLASAPPEAALADPFRTADVTAAAFADLRAAALAAASAPDARVDQHVELVRILVGGMFIPEALGEISRIRSSGAAMTPSQEAVLDEMEQAADALGPLAAAPGPRERPGPWATLAAARRGDPVTAGALRRAAGALADQSRWVAGEVLPHLFDAALSLGDPALGAELLAAAEAGTNLPGSTRFQFMQGRLAQARGSENEAFDFYALAMEGEGTAAAEARIALADLIAARGVPSSLPGLKRVLREGVAGWRGDDHARRLMTRLAAVTEETGDIESALKVMSSIISAYPASDEARLARTRIPVLLGALREDVEAGEVEIGFYLALVRELSRTMPESGEWVAARTTLAERMAAEGIDLAAAAEFRAIRAAYPLILSRSAPLRERLVLGEARARIRAGDHAGAIEVLAVPLQDAGEKALRAQAVLREQAGFLLAEGRMGESPLGENDALLLAARRAAAEDDPIRAADLYKQHVAAQKSLPRQDVSSYMRARSGTEASARVPADTLLGQNEDVNRLIEIGRTTAPRQAGGGPLSTAAAQAIVTRAAEAADIFAPVLGVDLPPEAPAGSGTPQVQ